MKVETFIVELEQFLRDRVGSEFYFEYATEEQEVEAVVTSEDDTTNFTTVRFEIFSVGMLDSEQEENE
mgnify:CR=1 FL=1